MDQAKIELLTILSYMSNAERNSVKHEYLDLTIRKSMEPEAALRQAVKFVIAAKKMVKTS